MADCIIAGETAGTLPGICPDCDRMIYRRFKPQKLNSVRGDLDITVHTSAVTHRSAFQAQREW
jgi:hypothetical protein